MLQSLLCTAMYCLAAAVTSATPAADQYQISLSLNQKNGIYRKGDTVQLTIDCLLNGKPAEGPLQITVFQQNGSKKTEKFDPAQKTFSYPLENGAVRFTVSVLGKDGKVIQQGNGKKKKAVSASIGAIAAPEEIQPFFQEPEDFQQFWDSALAELAKVPMKASRKEVDPLRNQQGKFKCWDVQVDCAGNAPVSGYLTIPVNAAPKSLPAVVSFQGAGVSSGWKITIPGAIHFNINAHGIVNGQPKEFYSNLRKNELSGYARKNADDREKFYFRNMFLRVKRALDYVKTLPEYDGKTLIVHGGSQGGAQAIVAAGLDPDVVLIGAQVPAMCDHGGVLAGRKSGWPQIIRLKGGKPINSATVKTLPYYDMAFFAKRIKAEAYFTVGLIDTTCCPSSVYAVYNCIPGKKEMFVMPDKGHVGTFSPGYLKRRQELIYAAAAKK
ncbi:MAG: acetylxylan esterase [Lentisphaeria bacterium]|nr:acetylxylan esterase [Lentisphaeria bacterium]